VGSAIQNCSFDFSNKVGPAPPEIIRIGPDDRWDIVIGDPRMTPLGLKVPLSGLGPGCGNPFSGYLWAMCEHDGWLYIATAVWAVFLRYAGRQEQLPKGLRNLLSPENVERMLMRFGGCDLWRTRDGLHWLPVTQNGFDNCFNIGFRNMVSSPYGLFVGAANPFSPEVATKRTAGWTYEKNQRGGLEIWMGSPARTAQARHPALASKGRMPLNREPGEEERLDAFLERNINAFYGDSGFRHFGFWRIDINDARTACENLISEVLAFIPEKKGTIVDVGCDTGATTRFLASTFPARDVVGITGTARSLQECRQRVPGAAFFSGRLPQLPLPAEFADHVVWIKGERPLGSRKKLLQEAIRVLKPGGRLVCFDLLSRKGAERTFGGFGRPRDSVTTQEEYRSLLVASGFQELRLIDVTEQCFRKFRTHAERYFDRERLAGRLDPDLVQQILKRLLHAEAPVGHCLLITGCKPAADPEPSRGAMAGKGDNR
jgi:ubiquinone/menaquinone biosynthesis C-methylase UbiE